MIRQKARMAALVGFARRAVGPSPIVHEPSAGSPRLMSGTSWGACHEQFLAACRQPPYAPEGGDAGVLLRDAGRRLWPCPQRPTAGAHLYKYNSGTGNWDDYTRLLNRTTTVIGAFAERALRNIGLRCADHSGLMLAARITLPHFSVSAAMKFANSAGELANTGEPKSAIRAPIFGSARATLIFLLSLSTISVGVFLGVPTP